MIYRPSKRSSNAPCLMGSHSFTWHPHVLYPQGQSKTWNITVMYAILGNTFSNSMSHQLFPILCVSLPEFRQLQGASSLTPDQGLRSWNRSPWNPWRLRSPKPTLYRLALPCLPFFCVVVYFCSNMLCRSSVWSVAVSSSQCYRYSYLSNSPIKHRVLWTEDKNNNDIIGRGDN